MTTKTLPREPIAPQFEAYLRGVMPEHNDVLRRIHAASIDFNELRSQLESKPGPAFIDWENNDACY